MTNKEFLERYDKKEEFSESELEELEYFGEGIDRIEGANRRWTRTIKNIFKVEDRYFALEFEEGLTEMQDNVYNKQPYEVEKVCKEITTIVVEYVKKLKG